MHFFTWWLYRDRVGVFYKDFCYPRSSRLFLKDYCDDMFREWLFYENIKDTRFQVEFSFSYVRDEEHFRETDNAEYTPIPTEMVVTTEFQQIVTPEPIMLLVWTWLEHIVYKEIGNE